MARIESNVIKTNFSAGHLVKNARRSRSQGKTKPEEPERNRRTSSRAAATEAMRKRAPWTNQGVSCFGKRRTHKPLLALSVLFWCSLLAARANFSRSS